MTDFQARYAELRPATPPDRLQELAGLLGLPGEAVGAMPYAWFPDEDCWVCAEVGPEGAVCGLERRYRHGSKKGMPGGKRGLFMPIDFNPGDDVVFVVEGASDTAAALAMGLHAVGRPSNRGGAAALAQLLRGQRVLIVGENDRKSSGSWPGRDGAVAIADSLAEAWGEPVQWCLPPAGAKDLRGFYHEHGEAGGALLRAHFDLFSHTVKPSDAPAQSSKPVVELVTRDFSDIEPEEIRWLWPGVIPLGKVTMLAGNPGLGKSFLTCDLAARLSTGRIFPAGIPNPNGPGRTLILNCEDDAADTIRVRLDHAGADVGMVTTIDGARVGEAGQGFQIDTHLDLLERYIENRPDTRLIVIDPVTAFCGDANADKNHEVRSLLRPLGELAMRTGVAVVIVSHFNKAGGSAAAYRTMGSLGWTAAVRMAWGFAADREDEDRRIMFQLKANIAPNSGGFAYRVAEDAEGRVALEWETGRVVGATADELLQAPGDGEASAQDEAEVFLRTELAGGPVEAKVIQKLARDAGIAEKTLRRAKAKLHIDSKRHGFGPGAPWKWSLPAKVAMPGPDEPVPLSLATYGDDGHLCNPESETAISEDDSDNENPKDGIDGQAPEHGPQSPTPVRRVTL